MTLRQVIIVDRQRPWKQRSSTNLWRHNCVSPVSYPPPVAELSSLSTRDCLV